MSNAQEGATVQFGAELEQLVLSQGIACEW